MWICVSKDEIYVCLCKVAQILKSHHLLWNYSRNTVKWKSRSDAISQFVFLCCFCTYCFQNSNVMRFSQLFCYLPSLYINSALPRIFKWCTDNMSITYLCEGDICFSWFCPLQWDFDTDFIRIFLWVQNTHLSGLHDTNSYKAADSIVWLAEGIVY
jgi:hypothetical protein